MKKRAEEVRRLRVFVLDSEALSLAVRGDRMMIARLDLAARGEAEIVTSPMTLVEAYDARTTEQRWDWVLSRVNVAELGKDEARQARRLLADAGLHGHKYAIDAVLAVVALRQRGQVTVFTSDPEDLERLLPDHVVVLKV
ncbi:PIN domain-containing protein [Kitasatospora sp. YST-16]|uniref:PIN domain-containing protein n=1 Tax=Kitasatospora sp. YST-16 TaxID=2998080 RepID=UPI002283AAEE|nr:PIN domain-containing protein [Kitasatospora sp. YST-16]WAL72669.1 PIN domain-containing protein [Kitasatospora sp. YST-16]WNW38717.1 PIN domain-containing protein [Streptomyces sp. Li-HN-5-13]